VTEDDIRRIYRATVDDLYGFAVRRCGYDRDLAEDITQETWLRAVRAWNVQGIPDRPAAWLTTVARNLIANHRRGVALEPLDYHDIAAPLPQESDARASLVRRALARLPLARRRLLAAFHFDRHSTAELAADAGVSERAIEGRLRRARQQLREQIETDPDSEGELP
jgi:RNA polymerase sigma-70 factor (ECF subfamily)